MRAGAGVIICLLVYMTGGCNAALAGETTQDFAREGWTLARQEAGVEIYRRHLAGSKFAALLARAEFHAEPEEVFVKLSDYEMFSGFIPGVEVSRVLKRQGQDVTVYQRLGFPAPVADRHYVIRIHNDPGESEPGIFRIEWNLDRSESAALPPRGVVVPGDFSGRWRLAPGEKAGMTNAVYEIHVDPGGRLPAWLFQRVAEGYVFQVMEAVRRRVEAAPSCCFNRIMMNVTATESRRENTEADEGVLRAPIASLGSRPDCWPRKKHGQSEHALEFFPCFSVDSVAVNNRRLAASLICQH